MDWSEFPAPVWLARVTGFPELQNQADCVETPADEDGRAWWGFAVFAFFPKAAPDLAALSGMP